MSKSCIVAALLSVALRSVGAFVLPDGKTSRATQALTELALQADKAFDNPYDNGYGNSYGSRWGSGYGQNDYYGRGRRYGGSYGGRSYGSGYNNMNSYDREMGFDDNYGSGYLQGSSVFTPSGRRARPIINYGLNNNYNGNSGTYSDYFNNNRSRRFGYDSYSGGNGRNGRSRYNSYGGYNQGQMAGEIIRGGRGYVETYTVPRDVQQVRLLISSAYDDGYDVSARVQLQQGSSNIRNDFTVFAEDGEPFETVIDTSGYTPHTIRIQNTGDVDLRAYVEPFYGQGQGLQYPGRYSQDRRRSRQGRWSGGYTSDQDNFYGNTSDRYASSYTRRRAKRPDQWSSSYGYGQSNYNRYAEPVGYGGDRTFLPDTIL